MQLWQREKKWFFSTENFEPEKLHFSNNGLKDTDLTARSYQVQRIHTWTHITIALSILICEESNHQINYMNYECLMRSTTMNLLLLNGQNGLNFTPTVVDLLSLSKKQKILIEITFCLHRSILYWGSISERNQSIHEVYIQYFLLRLSPENDHIPSINSRTNCSWSCGDLCIIFLRIHS